MEICKGEKKAKKTYSVRAGDVLKHTNGDYYMATCHIYNDAKKEEYLRLYNISTGCVWSSSSLFGGASTRIHFTPVKGCFTPEEESC